MRGHVRIQLFLLAWAGLLAVPVARPATCTVTTSGLNFGNYNVFSSTEDDVTATIGVNCTKRQSYTISLSTGSGTFASRKMKGTVGTLAYNLFLNATHVTIWGDGTSGTSTFSGTGTGAKVNTTVYGKVAAGQNVRMGTYSDSITITVTY